MNSKPTRWGRSAGLGTAMLLGATTLVRADTPAIVPVDDPILDRIPVPVAAPINTPILPRVDHAYIELELTNADVIDTLRLIAKSFSVKISIAGDVSGKIAYINLANETPEQAIEIVCQTAKLQFRKLSTGTFLIGKDLSDVQGLPPAIAAPAPVSSVSPGFASPLGAIPDAFGATSIFDTNSNGAFSSSNNMPVLLPSGSGSNSNSRERKSMKNIRVRNVPPRILAYWLDPANNAMPIDFQVNEDSKKEYFDKNPAKLALGVDGQAALQGNSSVASSGFAGDFNSNAYLQTNNSAFSSQGLVPETRTNFQIGRNNRGTAGRGGAAGGGVFQLPTGVERIVAIDPQNALLVFGTDEGVRQLQDTIAFLDQPLKQVEIEAQFITVSTSDSRQFGIDYTSSQGNFNASSFGNTPSAGNGALSVGYVRGNFQATLRALEASNRAKTITAPRVTAINNLTATLQSDTSSPLILNTVSQNIGGQQATGQNLIYITTSVGLTVTPTINNDDTITVLMQPQFQSQGLSGVANAPTITSQFIQTIANVRDGDTIALGGLRTKNVSRGGNKIPLLGDIPILGAIFRSRNATDSESELIIFLTARIVRRAGDDTVVPGT